MSIIRGNAKLYRPPKPVMARIFARITSFDGCWNMSGCHSDGYPTLSYFSKCTRACVISYWIHKGENPSGRQVMHSCDNPKCVNPEHLSLGTLRENLNDMRIKNRHAKGTMFPQSKLVEADIVEIRRSPDTNLDLARRYGVNPSVISRVRTHKVWKHV